MRTPLECQQPSPECPFSWTDESTIEDKLSNKHVRVSYEQQTWKCNLFIKVNPIACLNTEMH